MGGSRANKEKLQTGAVGLRDDMDKFEKRVAMLRKRAEDPAFVAAAVQHDEVFSRMIATILI